MSVDVRSDLIQGTDTCRECPAPIAQSGRGPRKVFCAACIARRRARGEQERTAARSPKKRAARAQYVREYRAARTPEQIEAQNQYQREWRAALSPEKRAAKARIEREGMLQRNYGLGVDEFDAMLAAQGGRCAICRTDEPGGKGWHVDHNHKTGAVRGILCSGCNTGIGLLRDDPALLRDAAAYIESHARRTS